MEFLQPRLPSVVAKVMFSLLTKARVEIFKEHHQMNLIIFARQSALKPGPGKSQLRTMDSLNVSFMDLT